MRRVCVVAVAAIAVWIPAAAASASNWPVPLAAGSAGEAQGGAAPQIGTVTATCTSSRTVTVSWAAVAHAQSYDIYQSVDSPTGPWAALYTGWTLTSYPTGTLPPGHTYYFAVQPHIGNWYGALSAPSAGRRVTGANCR